MSQPFKLVINSNKGKLIVKWSDAHTLAKYSNLQSGFYLSKNQSLGVDLLDERFFDWNQMFWSQREHQGIFNLNPDATIIDIGSGTSVVDLLLYSYLPKSKFYLIDEEQDFSDDLGKQLPKIPYSLEYPKYHSWSPVLDAINTSNFDPSRFTFLSPYDKFPENVDMISSYFSWCLHYPKEVYWDRTISSLKKGGKLVLDVRPIHGRDVIGEISEELKSNPVKYPFPTVDIDEYEPVDKGVSCYRCIWTKEI